MSVIIPALLDHPTGKMNSILRQMIDLYRYLKTGMMKNTKEDEVNNPC